MKKITQFHEHLINKSRVSKKLLLITALCYAFSVNAQLREVYNYNSWGYSGGNPQSLFEFDGRMFFTAGYYSYSDRVIFKSTGTGSLPPLGTGVSNNVVSNNFGTVGFKIVNSELYLDGYGLNSDMKIYKVSTSTGYATEVLNMTTFTGSTGSRFINPVFLNNKIIFTPYAASGGVGVEPYVIDLSNSANNGLLIDINSGTASSDPRYFTILNNEIFFSATDVTNGRELWKTDGTAVGTQIFANINFGNGSSDPDQFIELGSKIIFVATNAFTGRELFITDGTFAGTTILKNINPGNGDSNPTKLTKMGSEIYFTADNGTDGKELWKTDGTEAGTVQIKDINPTGDSYINEFVKVGNTIFDANNITDGHELWKTDGTTAGTVLVKNIRTGAGSSVPSVLTEYEGNLYFKATSDSGLHDLWISDGTSSGTQLVTNSTGSGAIVDNLFVFNNELYFKYRPSGQDVMSLWAYLDPTLSIDDFNSVETSISLFPNPANNYFEIESKETLDKVEIYSLQGQSVKSFLPQNRYDISDISSGVYFVKIQANNNEITKRIVKQ